MYSFFNKYFILVITLLLVPMVGIYADDFKQRSFRNEAGQWVTERSVEVAEYERRSPDIDGDILIGRSDIDGQSTRYWLEVRHEYDFSLRNLTQQDIESAALRLRSIRLNGVSIMTTSQNTRVVELRVDGDEVKEVIRIELSAEQFNQIIDSTSWEGAIDTPLVPNNIDLWMENERRTRANFLRLLR